MPVTPRLLVALNIGSWLAWIATALSLLYVVSSTFALGPIGDTLAAVACFYGSRPIIAWSHLRIIAAMAVRPGADVVERLHALAQDASVIVLPATAGPICESRWSGIGSPVLLITEPLATTEEVSPWLLHHAGHLRQGGYKSLVLSHVLLASLFLLVAVTVTSGADWFVRALALGIALTAADAGATWIVARRVETRARHWVQQQSASPESHDAKITSFVLGGPAYYLCQSHHE